MDLAEFKLTGVMSSELVKKKIKWKKKVEGKYESYDCDVFIKKVSFYDFEKMYIAKDEATDSQSAMIISTCVRVGENGEEKIPYEMACELYPALGISLVNAVHEVNKNEPEKK